jgi:peptidoglycan/LPS O-acetylase OafA/YrhL
MVSFSVSTGRLAPDRADVSDYPMVPMLEQRPRPTSPKRPGLDGLRAIAVLMVFFFHHGLLPFGWIGVQAFFVLSGFLITGILVRARANTLQRYLINFYGRRLLRIFPLYFTVIGLFTAAVWLGFKAGGLQAGLPYAATYTYNIWHASRYFQHSKLITHFWSLCVEEQFYLVWPFIVFFVPPQKLRRMLLGIVIAGPCVRLITVFILKLPTVPALPATTTALYVLTHSHFDAFAAGAYISVFPLGGIRRAAYAGLAAVVAAGLCVAVFSTPDAETRPVIFRAIGYPLGLGPGYAYVWGYSLLNIVSAILIDCLVQRKFAPKLFEWAPLAYLAGC